MNWILFTVFIFGAFASTQKCRVSWNSHSKKWVAQFNMDNECELLNLADEKHAAMVIQINSLCDKFIYEIESKTPAIITSMDWFDDLSQRDQDNAVELLSEGIQHHNCLNEDYLKAMKSKFGATTAQSQQLYELLYSKNFNAFNYFDTKANMDWYDDLDQRDKDNAVEFLPQSIKHYNGFNQDVLMDMEKKIWNNSCTNSTTL